MPHDAESPDETTDTDTDTDTNTDDARTKSLQSIFESVTGTTEATEAQDSTAQERSFATTHTTTDDTTTADDHPHRDPAGQRHAAIAATLDELTLPSNTVLERFNDRDRIHIITGYFTGDTDREIAHTLGNPSLDKAITRARLHLHLFRATDFQPPFDFATLRALDETDASMETKRAVLTAADSTIYYYQRVARAFDAAADHDFGRTRALRTAALTGQSPIAAHPTPTDTPATDQPTDDVDGEELHTSITDSLMHSDLADALDSTGN